MWLWKGMVWVAKGVPASLSLKDFSELLTTAQNWAQRSLETWTASWLEMSASLLFFWRRNFRHFANIIVLTSSKGSIPWYFLATEAARSPLLPVMPSLERTLQAEDLVHLGKIQKVKELLWTVNCIWVELVLLLKGLILIVLILLILMQGREEL